MPISPRPTTPPQSAVLAYALTLAACVGTTLLALPLDGVLDQANIVMLFLLTVLLVAVRLGRNPAILAAILSVLSFDVFFVTPRFSLAVSNAQYLITFAVMLATALITGHLAAGLREQARTAQVRERRTHALYETARQLAGALAVEPVEAIARQFVRQQLGAEIELLLKDAPLSDSRIPAGVDPERVRRAMQGETLVHQHDAVAQSLAGHYFPLTAPMQVRGVLAVRFPESHPAPGPEDLALLDALASLLAIAVERLHYVDVARTSEMRMAAEQLRNSILSALSHDLRTPLTALGGLAESLSLIQPALPPAALETAQVLHEQARRLSALVDNLLDLARFSSGEVPLRREWQPLDEVIGASIKLLAPVLAARPVRVDLPDELPLLCFDALLIERVLCNLIDNAAKHTPPETPIEITARQTGAQVEIAIDDHGAGLPVSAAVLFSPFRRGEPAASTPGSGLGLAICQAIVRAHGGDIGAASRFGGGSRFWFRLPAGTPPIIDPEA